MQTAYDEGWRTAYKGTAERHQNPYRKGVPFLMLLLLPNVERWAEEWERGWVEGHEQGRADMIEKRLIFARGL
jgi:hypothetical protein